MSEFYLTIKIHSNDRELLDDLVVTLESLNRDLQAIEHVDVIRSDEVITEDPQLQSYIAMQSSYQTEILERWIAASEGLEY